MRNLSGTLVAALVILHLRSKSGTRGILGSSKSASPVDRAESKEGDVDHEGVDSSETRRIGRRSSPVSTVVALMPVETDYILIPLWAYGSDTTGDTSSARFLYGYFISIS